MYRFVSRLLNVSITKLVTTFCIAGICVISTNVIRKVTGSDWQMRVLATKVVAKVYDLIVKGGFWPQTDPAVDVRDAPFLRFKGRVV